MTSKMILDLDRAAGRVMEGARKTQEELLDAMNIRLDQDGVREALAAANDPVVTPGEDANVVLTAQAVAELEEPDLGQVVSFGVWLIDYYRKRMLEADEQHRREVQEDWKMREARDEVAELAYEELTRLRKVMEGALHPRVAESALGIVGPTPREPRALARTLESAVSRLRERRSELPEIRVAGLVQDWDVLTDALEERFEALQGAINTVVAEVEAAKVRRRAKERAVQAYRDAAVGWSNAVRGMLIAAGLRESAEEMPATTPRRQSSSGLEPDSLPEDGEQPGSGDLPPDVAAEETPFDDDLPAPANEPETDAETA